MGHIPLPADVADERIQATARQLERMNYTPTLLIETPGFLTMRREDLEREYGRICSLSGDELEELGMPVRDDPESFRTNHLRLMTNHYLLLTRLRLDEPEAWDEVNELYEDD